MNVVKLMLQLVFEGMGMLAFVFWGQDKFPGSTVWTVINVLILALWVVYVMLSEPENKE